MLLGQFLVFFLFSAEHSNQVKYLRTGIDGWRKWEHVTSYTYLGLGYLLDVISSGLKVKRFCLFVFFFACKDIRPQGGLQLCIVQHAAEDEVPCLSKVCTDSQNICSYRILCSRCCERGPLNEKGAQPVHCSGTQRGLAWGPRCMSLR